ncbi:MAG: biotin synthase BioB [Desulfobacteraceae bacterium]|nr:biotin synthase BioB [Desulfobacteraceae bacterium]
MATQHLAIRTRVLPKKVCVDLKFKPIVDKIIRSGQGAAVTEHAIEHVLEAMQDGQGLIAAAEKIRSHFKGNDVFTCAIINAKSGFCSQDCAFCAQSAHHQTDIQTYDLLDAQTLIAYGLEMAAAGVTNYSIVTSGTGLSGDEIGTICDAARVLKEKTRLNLCASAGMLDLETAMLLKSAGISRYHHNLETAASHFENICTTHTYQENVAAIQTAKTAGMTVCSGGIFGLGESWAQRIEMGLALQELDVDCVPINFLDPVKGTGLADRQVLEPEQALKCIALYRLIHPHRDITICGGRAKALSNQQNLLFKAGANGVMVGNYLTTKGRDMASDFEMISSAGMRAV